MNWRKICLALALMTGLLPAHFLQADTVIRKMPTVQPAQPRITTTPKPLPLTPKPGMTVIQPQASFPELSSVAPASLQQGQSATLTLSGRNLSKDMVLIMGPDVTFGPIQQVGDKMLLLPITVAEGAAPGVRTISVQYKGVTKPSRARLTVTAVQAATVITAITPNSIGQGESKELTVSGKELHLIRQMNFGPGITAETPKPVKDALRIRISASPTATPGQRTVSYSDRTGMHTSRLPFMVTINPQPEPPGKAVLPIQVKTPQATPVVMLITPNQWTQGGEYEVTAQGTNLAQGLETRFAKGVEIKKLTVTSAVMARMTVRVADQAPLGRQWLEIRPGPDSKWARTQALAEVLAKPAATISVPAIKTVRPELIAITPDQWEPGKTYAITLQGAHLPETLEAAFGKDVVVREMKVGSAATASFTVEVAGSAAPGPRPMEARVGKDASWERTRLQAVVVEKKPALTVKPELPQLVLQPSISMLTPNRWYPGKSYEVTVLGDLFASGMSVELGSDVAVSNLKVANPTSATMIVTVGAKASPGPRSLRFRLSGEEEWRETGASGLVKAVYATVTPPMVIQPPLQDIEFAMGAIILEKPEHGTYWIMENAQGDHGTPKVTDSTRFEWKEEDVTSQWFELRILNGAGTVLMTRKVSGLPMPDRFYAPDAQFITEIFDLARNPQPAAKTPPKAQEPKAGSSKSDSLQPTSGVSTSVVTSGTSAISNVAAPQASGGIAQQLADSFAQNALFWEVAGYRKVTTQSAPASEEGGAAENSQAGGLQPSGGFQFSGAAMQQVVTTTTDVQVAISERWPIKLPAFSPTGLACSMANTQLTPDAIGSAGNIFYVGDTIQISGLINIEECPWALIYDTNWGQYSGAGAGAIAGNTPVNSWTIRNMFIDWGDGTYDVVTAIPGNNVSKTGAPISGEQLPPTANLNIKQQHTYRYSNEFPIRLFVLPAEDVGTIDSIVRMSKAPEPQPSQALRTPGKDAQTLLADSGTVLSDAINPSALSGSRGMEAASNLAATTNDKNTLAQFTIPGGRAFLLYCEPMILDIKADPAAIGPLHLEQLAIIEFSGQKTAQPPAQKPSGALQTTAQPSGAIQGAGQNKPATAKPVQTGQAQLGSDIAVQGSLPGAAQMTETSIAGQLSGATLDAAKASTCDAAFFATAELTYYGSGKIRLIWKVDGTVIHEQSGIQIGPSPERSGLKEDNTYAQDILPGAVVFTSPGLPLEKPAFHRVTVEAALEEGEKKYAVRAKEGSGGMVIPEFYSDQADQVVSEPRAYLVSAPKPGEPCIFRFPVAGGKDFLITGLQGRATKVNDRWSGTGTLLFDLPDGSSGQGLRYVDIDFQGFEVDDDGTVTSGTINAQNLAQTYDQLPGVSATLMSLKGSVKEDLQAVFDVKVKDNTIRVVETGGTLPPDWTGVEAPLIPESGWYAAAQKLPKTQIGHSYFQIQSDDVRLDLSRTQGSNPAGYSGIKIAQLQLQEATDAPQLGVLASGADWVGVHLGENAVLYPYLFMLTQASVTAKNWHLTDTGIAGHSRFNNFSHVFGAGTIAFDAIDITAADNGLVAEYINMRIEMPWPAMTLQGGSMKLDYAQKDSGADVEFNFAGQEATEDYGNVRMHTKVTKFERKATGWGMSTDTTFTFKDEQGTEVSSNVNDLFFNIYGVAYFNGDGTGHNAGLNAQTRLGNVQVQLQALKAVSHVDELKPERLDFTLKGKIDFPGLSEAPVDIVYTVKKPLGQAYTATGPKHSKFTTGISFPVGRPMAETTIAPEIKTSGGGFAAYEGALYASLDPVLLADASGGGAAQDTFGGTVETRMFGMDTPVKATFRYGTVSGDGYWLTHANVGGLNAPIFPGVSLQAVNGGLAYGFSKSVFSGAPLSATPDNPGVMVYSAGITVSSTAPQVFEMAGQITVLPEDAVYRMEFSSVKLLTYKVNGGAFFEYASNSFSGKVWGGMSMFGGAVSLTAPKGSDNDRGTVGLYFGPDDWEIYCGRQPSPIQLHFLIADVDGYMQLGQKMGLRLGGGLKVGSGKICLGIAAAEAYLNAMVGVGISPSAHLSADFWAGAGVSAWVPSCSGAKFSISKSINFHVEAMPLHLNAGFDIDCGWFGDYSLNVTLI